MVGTTKDETEDGCLIFFEKIEKFKLNTYCIRSWYSSK
jgi:hypothetical protein